MQKEKILDEILPSWRNWTNRPAFPIPKITITLDRLVTILTTEQGDEIRAEAKIVCRWLDEYESSFPPEHISTWAVGHIRGWVSLQGDNPILNANTEESKVDEEYESYLKNKTEVDHKREYEGIQGLVKGKGRE